jgi:uncharacterized protein (TIGR02677 family)
VAGPGAARPTHLLNGARCFVRRSLGLRYGHLSVVTGRLLGMEVDRLRLQAYRYAVADEAISYVAVMRVFTEGVAGLLSDLSAAEVQAALESRGTTLDPDTVEARLVYLVEHGNLARSPREAEARSIREYLTTRARYQLAPRGELVHRQVEELLGSAGRAREVSTEVLPVLLSDLEALADPAQATAGAVTALFAVFERLVVSTRDFYTHLGEVLARADTDRDSLAAYREVLLDYLQRFVEEVRRYEPLVIDALDHVDVEAVLSRTQGGPRLTNVDGTAARRSVGLQAGDWDSLHSWFRGGPGRRSDAEEIRSLATRAMGTLLSGLRRAVSGEGELSRRADLLRLAGLFDRSEDDTAHRIWARGFGLYSARHLSAMPEVEDVPATTSWWDAPAADVPLSLREYGDRAARGRSGRREDFAVARQRRLAERQQVEREREAALDELLALAGGSHTDIRVSDAARTVLLDLYAQALSSAGGPLEYGDGAARAPATDLVLVVRRTIGVTTTVISPSGRLSMVDVELSIEPVERRAVVGE